MVPVGFNGGSQKCDERCITFMSYRQSFSATVFIRCSLYSVHPSQLWPTVGQSTITEEANYSLDVNVALLFQVSDQSRLLFPSNSMHIVLAYVHDADLAINCRFAIDLREWAMSHFMSQQCRDASTGHSKLLSPSILKYVLALKENESVYTCTQTCAQLLNLLCTVNVACDRKLKLVNSPRKVKKYTILIDLSSFLFLQQFCNRHCRWTCRL